MIGYVTVGTQDLNRAAAFYDALLGELGASRMMEGERLIAWTAGPKSPGFCVALPFDGQPASAGNGTMVAFAVNSPAEVEALHAKALGLGATDEGAPGPRSDGAFYCAYFRDLDGNKFNAFCMGS
ncbi:VOC family protein [Simiduia sp. 21SJ11W-1]|uniref:VOC family protein n=1 Tax=Simiduia sp. 21SJ11W-1 TaxID=2909669 RepID=UPI0020A14ED4|nr:VOC family protein [Simiduia sp. 21SJ11W-1]UTA48045.1 VOC family protein [Simiduia sp. 21SJ11W-1]